MKLANAMYPKKNHRVSFQFCDLSEEKVESVNQMLNHFDNKQRELS